MVSFGEVVDMKVSARDDDETRRMEQGLGSLASPGQAAAGDARPRRKSSLEHAHSAACRA